MGSKSKSKLLDARAYILAHSDESKEQQAVGASCSVALIAIARKSLIDEGKLAASRKVTPTLPTPAPTDVPANPTPPPGLLDHQAMLALADIAALEDLDDDEVQRRLLKQCIRFAFDPKLHADTRMSASVQWGKLRDSAKSNDLGPGPPMTRTAAFDRYKDLTMALGDVDLVVEALFAAYPSASVVRAISSRLALRGASDEGLVSAEHGQAEPGGTGTSPTP